jgi:hypothetical protein
LQNLCDGLYCFPQFTQNNPGTGSLAAVDGVRKPHLTQNFATAGSSQAHLGQNIVDEREL